MEYSRDVIAELSGDHREALALLQRIQALPSGDKARKDLLDEVTIDLVRHAVAEEEYLYPAVRERIAHGDVLADKELADHIRMESLLKDLAGRTVEDAAFDRLVDDLIDEVRAHTRDEEQRVFVLLRQACSPKDLRELGDKVRKAKKTAPTRPHPGAPVMPPANKLLAAGLGLVDRARDALTGRGRS
ncbi:hemerythrin domain-containing protein [Streptomyces sp. Pv4-95]|uniref:hemerythrin domain-containing protein n=1 Tax=Streptomyces sp. Pv4-95 TaxID=3049543 RepID=UPI00389127E5